MRNIKKPSSRNSSENSTWSTVFVPVLVALIAGSTSPWWISLIRSERNQSVETPVIESNSLDTQKGGEQFTSDAAVERSGTVENANRASSDANDNSVDLQGQGNQAVVQGSGNNVIQGSGNQLTFEQASEAASRGEFELPTISGMSYHGAREKLIEKGWIPTTQRHMYGAHEPGLQYGNGKAFWDTGYWEVVSCSGIAEGFCRFHFDDPSGRRLVIITAGMEDRSRGIEAQVNRVFFEDSF